MEESDAGGEWSHCVAGTFFADGPKTTRRQCGGATPGNEPGGGFQRSDRPPKPLQRTIRNKKGALGVELERADPVAIIGEGVEEVLVRGCGGRAEGSGGWRMRPGELGAQNPGVGEPPLDPPVGGGDGGREGGVAERLVDRGARAVGRNEGQKACGCQMGVGDQVAPENGKGAAAPPVAVPIRAKKRNLLTSRSWVSAR